MRALVLLLLLVNVALWGWNAGWLPPLVGVAVDGPREPERMARQVNPEGVRLVREPRFEPARPRAAPASDAAPGSVN